MSFVSESGAVPGMDQGGGSWLLLDVWENMAVEQSGGRRFTLWSTNHTNWECDTTATKKTL